MNTPISTALAQAIIDQGDAWFEGGLSKCEAGEITAALTELLALRAEVDRLRAVEQVAREFVTWVNGGPSCPVCKSDITFTGWSGHYPHCRAVKLNATLANLSSAN